jgi:hypothetical protein
MTSESVLGTEDLRRSLTAVLTRMRTHPQEVVTVGRQRRPEAVLVSFHRWTEMLDAMRAPDPVDGPAQPGRVGLAAAEHAGTTGEDLHWDPRDGVAFEVAESVLGNLISFCVAELSALEQATVRDEAQIQAWRDRLTGYARQRKQLHISEPATLAAVIERYGNELRELTHRPSR